MYPILLALLGSSCKDRQVENQGPTSITLKGKALLQKRKKHQDKHRKEKRERERERERENDSETVRQSGNVSSSHTL